MAYVVFALLGMCGGGFSVFMALEEKRRHFKAQQQQHEVQVKESQDQLELKVEELDLKTEELDKLHQSLETWRDELSKNRLALVSTQSSFDNKAIAYADLQTENTILKRDLRNVALHVRKLELDHEVRRQTQQTLDTRINDLGSRYLKDNVKWISKSLTQNNFVRCKKRLQDVIERCRAVDFDVKLRQNP